MPTRSPAQRETEGSRPGAIARGNRAGNRGRGRPKGSKNRAKGLIPLPLAEDIISSLQPMLPPEQLRYLRSVVKDGAALDTRRELDTLILLLNRSIWPALVSEAVPKKDVPLIQVQRDTPREDEGDTDFEEIPERDYDRPPTTFLRKDVTDRLKVLASLLNLRSALDKAATGEGSENPNEQPLVRIFADRSIANRIGVLVGVQPGGLSGDVDGTERLALPARTVSNPSAERPEPIPVGEQE